MPTNAHQMMMLRKRSPAASGPENAFFTHALVCLVHLSVSTAHSSAPNTPAAHGEQFFVTDAN